MEAKTDMKTQSNAKATLGLEASDSLQSVSSYVEISQTLRRKKAKTLFDGPTAWTAFRQSFVMLRPDIQWKNPVMFVV
jgi:K+-transporting ATPase ATPase B chain